MSGFILRTKAFFLSLPLLCALEVSTFSALAAEPYWVKSEDPAGLVIERTIEFPTDGLKAPGTLAFPAHPTGKLPILVMVQGSGVQDRDSTIGPNKIFRQVAIGLAARGVATLRYDRRPKFARANFMEHLDLDHEVVIDAAAALAYCTTLPEVDPHAIYLLGHSLGAQLAPDIVKRRLGEQLGSVPGMILLSGIARPIDVVMLEQVRTLGTAQGGTPEQIEKLHSDWGAVFTAARDPKVPDVQPLGVGSKLPASYWRDWLRRDPVATMATLPVPALVLRGENDKNASHSDFESLRKAAKTKGSSSREFVGLNHEYQLGSGDGTETQTPADVAASPIETIAEWVKAGQSH